MRQLVVGAALLVSALIVTFAAASILQGMAISKRTIVAEPFAVERITPAGGRSLILAGRHAEM
jgi:hypothetical protein